MKIEKNGKITARIFKKDLLRVRLLLYWRALRGVSLQETPTREARIVVKREKGEKEKKKKKKKGKKRKKKCNC